MAPEYVDSGIKYYWSDLYDVKPRSVPLSCVFFPEDRLRRVRVVFEGYPVYIEGWHIGVMEAPADGCVDYQIIVQDNGGMVMVHESKLERV